MPPVNSAPTAAPPSLQAALNLAKGRRSHSNYPLITRDGYVSYRENEMREGEVEAAYAVYLDRFGDRLISPENRSSTSLTGVMPINNLPRWLDLWSALYKTEPSRIFYRRGERVAPDSQDSRIVEALQDRYRQAAIDEVMRETDNLLRLMGNVVMVPHFDEMADELVIHQYLSHRVRVVENRNNPARPHATVLLGTMRETQFDGSTSFVDIADIWSEDTYSRLVGESIVESIENVSPPLVHCFDKRPTNESGYFVNCPGPLLADLAMRLINDGYSDLNYTALMQGFGVAQIFGQGVGEDLKVGPGRVVKFSGEADRRQGVEFASPNAPLLDRIEVVKALVEAIRNAYGIPASMLDVSTDASGAAIVQANGPLAEIRLARAVTFRRIETEFLRATLTVLAGRVGAIPSNINPMEWDVAVMYGKPQASASTTDKIAQEKHDLEAGIVTPAELLMQRKPDQFDTIADADAFLHPEGAQAVNTTVLNGAQVTSLKEIVEAVSAKTMAPDAAIELVKLAFPQVPADVASRMIESAAKLTVVQPERSMPYSSTAFFGTAPKKPVDTTQSEEDDNQ